MEEQRITAASGGGETTLDISYELYIVTLTVISIVVAVLSYLYVPIDERMSRCSGCSTPSSASCS